MLRVKIKNVILELLYTVIDGIEILRRSNMSSIKKYPNTNNTNDLLILGNGKSLLEVRFTQDIHQDFMVVNRAVYAPNYCELRPRYYVVADPLFWKGENGLNTIKAINEKTTWDMIFFAPNSSRKGLSSLITSPNIKLVFFNTTRFRGLKPIRNWLYLHQIAMPTVINVIVAAIMNGILLNHKNIFLYGVEHSWLSQMYVGDDNQVYLNDTHYYDQGKKNMRIWLDPETGKSFPMSRLMKDLGNLFAEYVEINEFAKKICGVNIYNKTRGSFIDAFPR